MVIVKHILATSLLVAAVAADCLGGGSTSRSESALEKLEVFRIDRTVWRGIDVFSLRGGLSAEYAVQKSVAALVGGVSHTWAVTRHGYGPDPVWGSRNFTSRAVRATIDAYDASLGPDAAIDTVIVTPGVASVPYVAHATHAAVLPSQFLVSVGSCDEIRSVLDGGRAEGIESFCTLGHDGSIDPAVGWIKLLRLPPDYLDFIRRRRVRRVLLMGCTGTTGGETKARRLLAAEAGRPERPGTVFMMYPGTSPDDAATLRSKIADYDALNLGRFEQIADWESGVTDRQLDGFAKSIAESGARCEVLAVTAEDTLALYDSATNFAVAWMAANRAELPNAVVRGVCVNPYLVGHPLYESFTGRVPLLYWQGIPAAQTVARLHSVVQPALTAHSQELKVELLTVRLNTSNNCGGGELAAGLRTALIKAGFGPLEENTPTADEVWDPHDGVTSPVERVALDLSASGLLDEFRSLRTRSRALTTEELRAISAAYPALRVRSLVSPGR